MCHMSLVCCSRQLQTGGLSLKFLEAAQTLDFPIHFLPVGKSDYTQPQEAKCLIHRNWTAPVQKPSVLPGWEESERGSHTQQLQKELE